MGAMKKRTAKTARPKIADLRREFKQLQREIDERERRQADLAEAICVISRQGRKTKPIPITGVPVNYKTPGDCCVVTFGKNGAGDGRTNA